MEKFAIDLDKVLDDFEFNEDCAEQIASVNPSNNASASVAKCNFESPSLKTYNYHVIEPGKINKELDVSALETHKDAQQVNKENRFLNDKEKATDNLNYSKEEPTIGTNDSINHFHPDNCENDSKIVQKQGIMPYDSDQLPSTIHNEVSQKLQKQQNGSSNSKIDNRYDNKLNQPNIKPSVSNVFNSLNEYINAPSGNLDYIHPMLGAQKIGCNIEYNSTQNVSALCAKSTITTHSELVKNITKDTSIEHGGASSITDIVIGTGVSNYQGFTVPVTIGSLVTHNTNTEKDSTSEVAIRNSEEMSSEKQLSTNVTITAIDGNDTKYEYADLPINSGIQESQVIIDSGSKREVENENIYNQSTLVYVSENIHDNERGQIAQVGSDKSTHECLHTQNEQSTTADVTETESKTNKTIIEVCADESDLKMKEESSHSSDKYIGSLDSLHKPFGFSSINDLSEEELTKYLAELEEEEKLNENNNMCQDSSMSGSEHIVSAYVVQSTSKDQKSDYTSETPVFENITIGELPSMPQEELKEKSKKFPVIDYSKEKAEEEVLNNFVEKQHLQEHVDQTKNIRDKESTLKEHKWKSLNKTESESVENADSKQLELPATTEGNSLIDRGSSIIPERKCMADLKDTQSIQEHHTYNINVDQGSLSNVKTEIQLKETKEVALNSEQYKPSCDVKAQNDIDHDCEETNTLNDNAEYSNLATPKPVELSTESSMNEGTDESEKPVRPQTLDIVLTNNPDEPETHGSTSDTPSRQTQSSIEGMKDDCQGSSPDALDNSLLEFSSVLGKQPPYWVPDSLAPSCMLCEVKFTVLKRRHHCRACGKVLCNKCCSMKYKLEYQGNIDSRVCVSCYQLLTKAETDQGIGEWSSGYSSYMGTNDINSPQGRQPNPNNPMEYCSTIPPLQQLAGGLPPPPTVMVPVGVLKREGGTKSRPEGSKSVMFSDGIRPGCDLTELDMSWDLKPPYRKPSNKRIPTPGSSLPSTTTKRQNLPRLDPNTESYIPQDPNALPPTVTIHKGQVSYHVVTDADLLYKTLKNECEPPVMFAINRNLYAYVKITYLNCCVNKICWNVTSRGLACVGQDEVILLVETLPDETRIPKDLLIFINQLYIEAFKGNTVSELGFSIYQGGNLLSSREHAGFLFIRQTLQCLQKIILPPAPFLVGLLVHRWETPWAKVFPLRLLLRLGAEYRYYPCPLVSVRFRDALYFEIGHTVMKVLADFRNFGYTLPGVRGLTIHLRNRMTDVMFPRNRYDQVIKGLNNSNDHVLAYASNFSISADSHLVCIQTNTGDESSYQTQAINIHNKPRTVTGASFIVINGALKSSMGLSAKSSIVEDGLMVEIMPEKMEALKAALKNMQDFSIGCGRQGAPEPDETVNIKWIDNDVQFNLGVKSPIDGQLMDGIPSIRVHSGTDYKGTSRFIRWTEVFIIKSDDHPSGVHDPVDINKLSGNIAKATCTALVKLLDLLATAGLTKLGVRTTIHPDNVGYEAGSEGTKLPPIYMNSLDNELIQVLHKAAQSSQDNHTVLELIFYILDD